MVNLNFHEVALEGHILGHEEQDEVADQGHPEQGHEQGWAAGHQGQAARDTAGGQHHAATHVGQGLVDHITTTALEDMKNDDL